MLTAPTSILETFSVEQRHALMKKWAPNIRAVRSVKTDYDDAKALGLALCLENVDLQFERARRSGNGIFETVQTSDVGPFKMHYFDIITAIFPNVIYQDLVSVQPMSQKIAQIFYLRYKYGSTKGSVSAGTVMADARTGSPYGLGYSDYSSPTIDAEIIANAGAAAHSGNLSWTPVKPGSVSITGNGIALADDGNGNIVPAAGNTHALAAGSTNNTINYLTGAFVVTFTADPGDALTATYQYNNEYSPAKVPEVNLEVAEVTVSAQSRKLKALYAMDAAFDLRMQQGIDIDDAILQAVSAEIMHEIDGEVCYDLRNQAALTSAWNRIPPNSQIPWTTHKFTLIDELIVASNKIFQVTQRSVGNFVIMGTNVANVLESIGAPRYVSSGATGVQGPHFAGTLDNKWKIYKDPYYDPDTYCVGYKGDLFLDSGYVFCPYLPVFTTQLLLGEDFQGRRGFATSNGKKMLNPNLYVRGTMTTIDPPGSSQVSPY